MNVFTNTYTDGTQAEFSNIAEAREDAAEKYMTFDYAHTDVDVYAADGEFMDTNRVELINELGHSVPYNA